MRLGFESEEVVVVDEEVIGSLGSKGRRLVETGS